MKHKKMITSIAFFLLVLGGLHAQQSVPASGGEATGNDGTLSYSVGQVAYTAQTGSGGSLVSGIQHVYEISSVTSVEDLLKDATLTAYPNPAVDYLNLTIEDASYESMDYQLIDMKGVAVLAGEIGAPTTTIAIERIPSATYFLHVSINQKIIKSFKLIKN